MIRHSVFFKFKSQAADSEKQEFFAAALTLTAIDGVQDFEILKEISPKNDFEFGLAMVFESDEVYQKYNGHPDHSLFVENYWLKSVGEFLEIDNQPITDPSSIKF